MQPNTARSSDILVLCVDAGQLQLDIYRCDRLDHPHTSLSVRANLHLGND